MLNNIKQQIAQNYSDARSMETAVGDICYVLQQLLEGYKSYKLIENNQLVQQLRNTCPHENTESLGGFETCKDCGTHLGIATESEPDDIEQPDNLIEPIRKRCVYWDCGFCYEHNSYGNSINGVCMDPKSCPVNKKDIPPPPKMPEPPKARIIKEGYLSPKPK